MRIGCEKEKMRLRIRKENNENWLRMKIVRLE